MKNFLIAVLLSLVLFAPVAVSAQTHSVALSFTASTTPGVTGYNMYRAPCTGTITAGVCSAAGTPVKLNSTPFTALSYTDTTVAAGSSYDYYATSVCPVCAPTESAQSNHVAATIPKDVPLPPGNLSITNVTRNSTGANTTLSAHWMDAPGVPTTYTFFGNGAILTSGTLTNQSGSYSAVWAGKVKPGSSVTFEVCDATGACQSKLI